MYFLTNVLMIPMQQALSPIQPPQKYLQDSTRCKRLNSALIEMIVTDLQPISIVEDKRFLRYTSLLDQRYVPPEQENYHKEVATWKIQGSQVKLKGKADKDINYCPYHRYLEFSPRPFMLSNSTHNKRQLETRKLSARNI